MVRESLAQVRPKPDLNWVLPLLEYFSCWVSTVHSFIHLSFIFKSSEQVFILTLQILERHSVVGVGLLCGSDNNKRQPWPTFPSPLFPWESNKSCLTDINNEMTGPRSSGPRQGRGPRIITSDFPRHFFNLLLKLVHTDSTNTFFSLHQYSAGWLPLSGLEIFMLFSNITLKVVIGISESIFCSEKLQLNTPW